MEIRMNSSNGASSNNIVRFPKSVVPNVAIETRELAEKQIVEVKEYFVGEILDLVVPTLYNNLAVAGYPLDSDTLKDGALIVETIKSFLYKHHGITHSFQAVAVEMFEVDANEDITLVAEFKPPNPVKIVDN